MTNETQTNEKVKKKARMLIVEDQPEPLFALELAIKRTAPKHFPGSYSGDYDIARCFSEASAYVQANDYNLVLLDHRMPYENQVELEKKDFKAFCNTLENIGYSLIPDIKSKNPQTVVIGTSSLSREELREFTTPDFSVKKTSDNLEGDLEKIFTQMKGGND